MSEKFKPGQVWADRTGARFKIAEVGDDFITTACGIGFNGDGRYHKTASNLDLVTLISQPCCIPVTETPPCPPETPLADKIARFKALHAELSEEVKTPYPSIITHTDGQRLSIYGVNGALIVTLPVDRLEPMKAATGYPAFIRERHEFPSLEIFEYKAQS